MRFHLDENVDHAIADGLRRRGIDVTNSADANLIGASDEKQLDFSTTETRVLITHDRDFLRLHSLGAKHSGIAYCQPSSRSVGEIIRRLLLMHECLKKDEIQSKVEFTCIDLMAE